MPNQSPLGTTDYEAIGRMLDNARETVTNDRSETHGHVRENMQQIADFWNIYLQYVDRDLDAIDACLMMNLVKISRASAGSRDEDHFEDLIGYSGIGGGLFINQEEHDG